VPLCGKTRDLIWLEGQGNEVVGVELSDIAVQGFFDDNEIAYSLVEATLPAYIADNLAITIYCGDYFEFDEGKFDGYYDRGALVALTPDVRQAYVEHTRSLLSEDAVQLIISVEYDESIASGPPFSVPADEILSYWPGLERVDAYDDIENGPPKFREAGLDKMIEVVWRHG
jgi:thiopurine S-methyltransferase